MGIFNSLRNELIDIIEWMDDSAHTLVWRFPRYQNEIKNGARLIVRPGQVAVFVDQGQIADVFKPGMYTLSTKNIPILSTLRGWVHGFDSPFKCEVYFVSTRQITDLKWGTPNPIMMRDVEFGPVRLRAFGNYTLRALDPAALLREVVGTDGVFEASEVTELLRTLIASCFAELLGQTQLSVLDLAAQYGPLGEALRKRVCERIDDEYGLEIPQLHVVNITLPEEVEKAMDKRSSMGVVGDLQRYQQFQTAEALMEAAKNPNGSAGAGLGAGLGLAMGSQFAQGVHPAAGGGMGFGGAPAAAPPPVPQSLWHVVVGGNSQGPFELGQLLKVIGAGQVNAQSLVWTAGMPQWAAAGTLPQLAAYFMPTPPPPPVPGGSI